MAQMLRSHKSGEKMQRVFGEMAPRIIMCEKEGDGKRCKEGEAPGAGRDLTGGHWLIAHAAKDRALSVLEDALKKKDKLLMVDPEWMVLEGVKDPQMWMQRYAVVTEKRATNLQSVVQLIQFKEDSGEHLENTYAYVYSSDESRTVYLCPLFWEAPETLKRNSQPGTLIHEASHFLGTKDMAYNEDVKPMLFCYDGRVISPVPGAPQEPSIKKTIDMVIRNADNIEYEFELTLNHTESYTWGQYTCCGERNEDSVCEKSVPDHFLKYYNAKKNNAENIKKFVDMLYDELARLKKKRNNQDRKADSISESLDSEMDEGEALRKLLRSMSLDPSVDIQECMECVKGIVALIRRILDELYEFHDFQWPEGDTFASGLHSVAEEIRLYLLPHVDFSLGGAAQAWALGDIFRSSVLLLDRLVGEVEGFTARVLNIEDLHTFT